MSRRAGKSPTPSFYGTADNFFALYVTAGGRPGDGPRGPADAREIDIANRPGPRPTSWRWPPSTATDKPSPAGLIGRYSVWLRGGHDPGALDVDAGRRRRTARRPVGTRPVSTTLDWPPALEIAPFGAGRLGHPRRSRLTLSPVKADPFVGRFDLPGRSRSRTAVGVCLEADRLKPEEAAVIRSTAGTRADSSANLTVWT